MFRRGTTAPEGKSVTRTYGESVMTTNGVTVRQSGDDIYIEFKGRKNVYVNGSPARWVQR